MKGILPPLLIGGGVLLFALSGAAFPGLLPAGGAGLSPSGWWYDPVTGQYVQSSVRPSSRAVPVPAPRSSSGGDGAGAGVVAMAAKVGIPAIGAALVKWFTQAVSPVPPSALPAISEGWEEFALPEEGVPITQSPDLPAVSQGWEEYGLPLTETPVAEYPPPDTVYADPNAYVSEPPADPLLIDSFYDMAAVDGGSDAAYAAASEGFLL